MPRFHRCKPSLIEEVALQVDQIDRTRVRKYFNKGSYMLITSFLVRRYDSLVQDSLQAISGKSRGLPPENKQTA
jgi:hypothetical protein